MVSPALALNLRSVSAMDARRSEFVELSLLKPLKAVIFLLKSY